MNLTLISLLYEKALINLTIKPLSVELKIIKLKKWLWHLAHRQEVLHKLGNSLL